MTILWLYEIFIVTMKLSWIEIGNDDDDGDYESANTWSRNPKKNDKVKRNIGERDKEDNWLH